MCKNIALCNLSAAELAGLENALCARLANFVSFREHSLYFPPGPSASAPELLAGERRLFLPLRLQGEQVAVLMLAGVKVQECRRILELVPALLELCLENLCLARRLGQDALTGLAVEESLYSRLEEDVRQLRGEGGEPEHFSAMPPVYRLGRAIVLLRVAHAGAVARELGHAALDEAMRGLGRILAELPAGALAVRCGPCEAAVLLPGAGRKAAHEFAAGVVGRVGRLRLRHPLTGREFPLALCAGHALYPQDMGVGELSLPVYEQGHRLLLRARLAADTGERCAAQGLDPIFSFAGVLLGGGQIDAVASARNLRVSLGRNAKAAEGQRFAIRRRAAHSWKEIGELVLVRVGEEQSLAELVRVDDAAFYPAPGDLLFLLGGGELAHGGKHADGASADLAAGPCSPCLAHGVFLSRLARAVRSHRHFAVALLRASGEGVDRDRALQQTFRAWLQEFPCQSGAFGGHYGTCGLIFFHPAHETPELLEAYRRIWARAQELGLDAAVGVAAFPLAHFGAEEMEELAIKAAEYASLLPAPKVGEFNSLAMTISADKRASQGDLVGAIQEYELALLLDAGNAMARNSLGVCHAALGAPARALRHFRKALAQHPDAPQAAQICYNLGAACQALGRIRGACRYYRECLEHAPDHVFARLRLGQISERGGRRADARAHYEAAARYEAAAGSGNVARLQLARLARLQRRGAEARELLHELLLRDPEDAGALLLLAQSYLDNNEDPGMAETLARKSVSLHESPDAWQTLARALAAMGKTDEARLAEARAAGA